MREPRLRCTSIPQHPCSTLFHTIRQATAPAWRVLKVSFLCHHFLSVAASRASGIMFWEVVAPMCRTLPHHPYHARLRLAFWPRPQRRHACAPCRRLLPRASPSSPPERHRGSWLVLAGCCCTVGYTGLLRWCCYLSNAPQPPPPLHDRPVVCTVPRTAVSVRPWQAQSMAALPRAAVLTAQPLSVPPPLDIVLRLPYGVTVAAAQASLFDNATLRPGIYCNKLHLCLGCCTNTEDEVGAPEGNHSMRHLATKPGISHSAGREACTRSAFVCVVCIPGE